jgi:Xaa-Pro aminopeptidase
VGIEVHEFPTVSKKSDAILLPGMFVTIEPGVYIEGELGVRIEDFILITEDGCEVVSKSPKKLEV